MTMRKITELRGVSVEDTVQSGPGQVAFRLSNGRVTDTVALPPGPEGQPGRDGANVLPTDTAIANAVRAGGEARSAMDKTFANQVKVTAFGTDVGTGGDDTTAVQAAMDYATGSASVVFPAGGSYRVSQVTAHGGAHLHVEAGAEIVITGNSAGIVSTGAAEQAAREITSGATAGSATLELSNTAGVAAGDWLMITASDRVAGKSTRRGMLRKVLSVDGLAIELDGPLHTTLIDAPVAVRVSLAGPLTITGGGRIRGATPASQSSSLVQVTLGFEPILADVTVGPGGGPGLTLAHCVGGWSTAHFVDLMDDTSASHYGYAVNWTGATRGHVVRGGSATRVRHGVTTNSSPFNGGGLSAWRGEPEACIAERAFVVSECRSAGLDTHEEGYGIQLHGSVHNCSIGAQTRSRNTVMGGVVSGAKLFGFYTMPAAVGTIMITPTVLNMGQSVGAAAFRISSETLLESPLYPEPSPGVPAVNATADYVVSGGGRLNGSITGSGNRRDSLLGNAAVAGGVHTDLRAALQAMGVIGASVRDVNFSGATTSRFIRAVATGATDIPFRSDGASGQTGDLAQFRVNGVTKALVTAAGDLEVIDSSAGLILRSPDNSRWRVKVGNDGTLSTMKI